MLCSYALYSQGCQPDKSRVTGIQMYTQAGQDKTNLSNFHGVLRGTTGVIFDIVLLGDFVEPETKKKSEKEISPWTAVGISVLTPAVITGNADIQQEKER